MTDLAIKYICVSFGVVGVVWAIAFMIKWMSRID